GWSEPQLELPTPTHGSVPQLLLGKRDPIPG
ncbi:MAG: hypothetical protein ACI91B_001891, partial [Planctomycetota bacterium]